MNVFADLHQDDLYYSLRLLFEKRLGWKLYRPIGFDWWEKGFWKYCEKMEVVDQYLRIHDTDKNCGEHYLCYENKHDYYHKALTFEQFLKKKIDIVIASVTSHEETYHRLIQEHKPRAKLIRQAGNVHDTVNFNFSRNVMASCYLTDVNSFSDDSQKSVPRGVNLVVYHQEFDTDIFKYSFPSAGKRIINLMNCLPDSRDFAKWGEYQKTLKEFDFKMYGILGYDGIIGTTKGVAEALAQSKFLWHVKYGGDGFGHVIHNAFAMGRPPILKGSYYADKLAGHLIQDGVTCIDLENGDLEQNVEKIKFFARPDNYYKMSRAAHQIFSSNINYDKEFILIKKFLKNLI